MAAYRWVTACTPGSAPGPTRGNEYGKPLPFLNYQPRFHGAPCRSVLGQWPADGQRRCIAVNN